MDPRPPPPVTIEGGPGWQLGDAGPDRLEGAGPGEPAAVRGRGRQAAALALAAAVGFGAATLLAEQRQHRLDTSRASALSLDVELETVDHSTNLVATAEGRPAVAAAVVLRNTGSRPVALDAAEVLGTPYRAEELAGRRVEPGRRTVLRLLRTIDCTQVEPTGPAGPLRIREATGAGARTIDVRLAPDALLGAERTARAACGLVPPDQAVLVTVTPTVSGATARLLMELSNASVFPVLVQAISPAPGLRLVSLRDQEGADVGLPLELPPGDYDPPRERVAGRGPAQVLVAVLAVHDCDLLRRPSAAGHTALVEIELTDAAGREAGGTSWGEVSMVGRLPASGCPLPGGAPAADPAVVVDPALRAPPRPEPAGLALPG